MGEGTATGGSTARALAAEDALRRLCPHLWRVEAVRLAGEGGNGEALLEEQRGWLLPRLRVLAGEGGQLELADDRILEFDQAVIKAPSEVVTEWAAACFGGMLVQTADGMPRRLAEETAMSIVYIVVAPCHR